MGKKVFRFKNSHFIELHDLRQFMQNIKLVLSLILSFIVYSSLVYLQIELNAGWR